MRRYLLPMMAVAALSGCSAGKDMQLAQNEVARFHTLLDGGRFAEIYATAGPELRRDASEEQWVAMLTGIHNFYGNVAEAKSVGFNVNYTNGSGRVSLVYETKFARATGKEDFVYDIDDNKITLAGYHIEAKQPS
jgi:hypothetical protein